MASTIGVTSAPSVPFRRFLPHEKTAAPPARYRDYHAADVAEEPDRRFMERMPPQMLSDQDMSVLMDARLAAEEAAWKEAVWDMEEQEMEKEPLQAFWRSDLPYNWQQSGHVAIRAYLPVAFSLAARP